MIKRISKRDIKPWFAKRPLIARACSLGLIPLLPVIYVGSSIYEGLREAWPSCKTAFWELLGTAFLPWDD